MSVRSRHYVGDELGLLTRAASWLAPTGRFVASFDVASVRRADGTPVGRTLTKALREAGFSYDSHKRLAGFEDAGRSRRSPAWARTTRPALTTRTSPRSTPATSRYEAQGPTPATRSTLMRVTNPGGGFSIGGNFTSGPR